MSTKTITITVTGQLEMPSISDVDAIAGKSIDIDLEEAVVSGLKAQLGQVMTNAVVGGRRGGAQVNPELNVLIQAKKVIIREVEPPAAPADPPADPAPAPARAGPVPTEPTTDPNPDETP